MSTMDAPKAEGLLVRLPAEGVQRLAVEGDGPALLRAGDLEYELEPVLRVGGEESPSLALRAMDRVWCVARSREGSVAPSDGWEAAYQLAQHTAGLAAIGAAPDFVEPDFVQSWPHGRSTDQDLAADGSGVFDDQEDRGGAIPTVPGEFAWHLGDDFSQLRLARDAVATGAEGRVIRIAHLDTGYDPKHATFVDESLDRELQRNFIDGEDRRRDARDPGTPGLLHNPGHGAATLAILAGGRFRFSNAGYDFDDVLGGAPHAKIVPIRVGNSVVQLKTSSVARGVGYAADLAGDPATAVHVISMSMGGLASAAWAEAVNRAYLAGIVFVGAAGNNFSPGLPARSIVFPARFERVIAACGVMADGSPYFNLPLGMMQGCWGPRRAMRTAISAYTPNTPWAEMGADDIVDMNGAGTSSATPQIAAAAALYMQRHHDTLFNRDRYSSAWMRVECVRRALFDAAKASHQHEMIGHGTLRARDALDIVPAAPGMLRKASKARAWFAFLRTLTGLGASASRVDDMLQLEATQLVQRWSGEGPNPLEAAIEDPDSDLASVPPVSIQRFLGAMIEHPDASTQLRRRADHVRRELGGRSVHRVPSDGVQDPPAEPLDHGKESVDAGAAAPRVSTAFQPPDPTQRALRVYALDPSLSHSLDTLAISEMACAVPWERVGPGPRGEYVEVIDLDPATGCFYEPIDLDDPRVLAQDGLAPSEGTPQFHQQMVYAVAMSTIAHFEHALGRRALWRPGPSPDPENPYNDSNFVRRLRIHPHALREANAYYSPSKVALLFGYFDARPVDRHHTPGSRVFTCLSHDIVAHETSHALLDGMHRRFLLPSNPDVRAFHEAFADIVALFQHFTFPELLRHEIARARGDIRRDTLFGKLAIQFGLGRGIGSALRDAIGGINKETGKWMPHKPDPGAYRTTEGAHARGALLVAAVFDAFLSIYDRRVGDLLRLATGGSGVLREGAIHPDLVNRLAHEASKAARHVLTMCIRALDYCPPTDITFSDYLRAILSADYDLVRDDSHGYRTAFVEAFRKRGIFPHELRTMGTDSLVWRSPEQEEPPHPHVLRKVLEDIGGYTRRLLYTDSREEIFHLERRMRISIYRKLRAQFARGPGGANDATFLGLEPPRDGSSTPRFEVHSARLALRQGPAGPVEPRLMIGLLQRVQMPSSDRHAGDPMVFEGGCTIVADLRTPRVLYCVRKRVGSRNRARRQRAYLAGLDESVRSVYLGAGPLRSDDDEANEPFAFMHRSGAEHG